jgi:hypothetical protein
VRLKLLFLFKPQYKAKNLKSYNQELQEISEPLIGCAPTSSEVKYYRVVMVRPDLRYGINIATNHQTQRGCPAYIIKGCIYIKERDIFEGIKLILA